MAARLVDNGFDRVDIVERDPHVFGEPETENLLASPHPVPDLNTAFADELSGPYEVIVASEVVEHLENPLAFVRETAKLVSPGGYLLLTTPNVANWVGRVRFLLFGELRWFDHDGYTRLRHLSPVTDSQMRNILDEAGFDLVAVTSAGSFAGPLRVLATFPLALPFLAVLGRRGWGDCNLFLAVRRAAAV
jgi:SAM-dependent methyltransferase